MKAEIITIGDEILIGQITDTNSAWISSYLNGMGIRVAEILSVGDQREEIVRALDTAFARAELVIVTGGLGPTKDDITKKTLAEYFGGGMREDPATYGQIMEMLSRRGVDFNELNRSQAMVPRAAEILPNSNGTAPGMWFEREGRILVSLPGVPFEMKALMEEQVMPRLHGRFALKSIRHKTAVTSGIAESVLAERIAQWENALPSLLHLAYLPGTSGVRLRLSAYDVDTDKADSAIAEQFERLRKIIPDNFIGFDDASPEQAVAGYLTRHGKKLAVAESCTGGMIAGRFTAMPGASEYFMCGVVSYSNKAKIDILRVDKENIEKYGAVSRQVAEQMAQGALRLSGADYAISTTGIAGPTGGTVEKPVGTVWMAVAYPGGVESQMSVFGLLRQQNMERASSAAINMLRMILSKEEG